MCEYVQCSEEELPTSTDHNCAQWLYNRRITKARADVTLFNEI